MGSWNGVGSGAFSVGSQDGAGSGADSVGSWNGAGSGAELEQALWAHGMEVFSRA